MKHQTITYLSNRLPELIKIALEKIKPNLQQCAIATNIEDLAKYIFENQPDIIILDRSDSIFFENEHNEQLFGLLSNNNVLFLSDINKPEVNRIHRMGAKGFVTYSCPEIEIKTAIEKVASGEKYFSKKVIEILIEMSYKQQSNQPNSKEKENKRHETLSDREMEILKCITEGKSADEIANNLFISIHTVYTHRKNILKKLSCKSATELVTYAYNTKLFK